MRDFSGLDIVADRGLEKTAGMEKKAIAPLLLAALGAWGMYSSGKDAYHAARNGQYGKALLHAGLAAASGFTGGTAGVANAAAKGGSLFSRLGWAGRQLGRVGHVLGCGKNFVATTRPGQAVSRAVGAVTASRPVQAVTNAYRTGNKYAGRWNDLFDKTQAGRWVAEHPWKFTGLTYGAGMLAGSPNGAVQGTKAGIHGLAENPTHMYRYSGGYAVPTGTYLSTGRYIGY